MEQVSAIVNRAVGTLQAEDSCQPQESTTGKSPSWSSEIEKHLRHWGIADDVIDGSLKCLDQGRSISATMEQQQRGFFLHGPQGRGKTTLATAVLRYELERFFEKQSPYRSIRFVFVPDLLLELQSCFVKGSEKQVADVIYRVSEYDFLVLDGMGEGGRQSHFVVGALGTLIHHRDAARKSKRTMVTANYNTQVLAELTDARIASRISGMCEEIPFSGKDRRLA